MDDSFRTFGKEPREMVECLKGNVGSRQEVFGFFFLSLSCPGLFVLVFKIGDAYKHMYVCVQVACPVAG